MTSVTQKNLPSAIVICVLLCLVRFSAWQTLRWQKEGSRLVQKCWLFDNVDKVENLNGVGYVSGQKKAKTFLCIMFMKMHIYENKNVGCLRKYFHPLCHANKWLWYPIKLSWWRGFYLWFFVNLVYACIGFNFQACSFGKLTWLQFDIQNYSSAPTLNDTLTLQISTKYVFRVKTEF